MKSPPFFPEKGRRRGGKLIYALFPGKRADFSFSAWAVGGGRRADFTEGPHFGYFKPWLGAIILLFYHCFWRRG